MKYFLTVLIYLFASMIFGQQPTKISESLQNKISKNNSERFLIWVNFIDKNSSDIELVKEIITPKALARREKVGFKVAIDHYDLPVKSEYINTVRSITENIKRTSNWLNAVSLYADFEMIKKIENLNFVKKVSEVRKYRRKKDKLSDFNTGETSSIFAPTSVEYNLDYGSSLTQNEVINTAAVHDLGYTGKGILICVMDAGFDRLSHEAFATLNIVDTWDFVNNDADVEDGSDMGEGSHGTSCLSLIGGYKEGKLIGTAYGADYLLAKTENTDSETPLEEDNWVAAAEWAENLGADIFTTSLGYLDFDNPNDNYTYEDMDGNTAAITIAADIAVKKGIVVFNSAGNEGSHSSRNTLSAPADGDSVFAIGSVTSSGSRSSFSSVGPTFDGRIKPDFMSMGSGTYAASNNTNRSYNSSFSGTSAACPLAAGVGALLLEKNYSLTPMQIREILRNTSSNSLTPDRYMGWGILDALAAIQEIPEVVLELKIMLEGSYDSATDEMKNNLIDQVPLKSPYTANSRRLESIPSNIMDWVLVELRETINGPAMVSKSFLLHKDGRIVADDGVSSTVKIPAEPGSYYVVVKHRNHIRIMSSLPLALTAN